MSRRVVPRLLLPRQIEQQGEYVRRCPSLLEEIRASSLAYVTRNRRSEEHIGRYAFKVSGPPLLYASCYAALLRHLFGDLDVLSASDRRQWATYIQGHQGDDGLFRDPLINCPLAEQIDWWGWRHLTLHALMALAALDATAEKTFRLLDPFKKRGEVIRWLESRTWAESAANVSNEVQNYGTFLQYARDRQGQDWCQDVLDEMCRWLDRSQDAATGLWGPRFDTPYDLSQGVQAGYHIWMLYFYDGRPVQYEDKIIDSCLATQNKFGGFGVLLNSSACEDIDSVDPLVRLYHCVDHRRTDIQHSLQRALPWILANHNRDGGWVFRRYQRLEYGHPLMAAGPQESSMFPTWFRCLTLAYLFQIPVATETNPIKWRFLDCPGHQFFYPLQDSGVGR